MPGSTVLTIAILLAYQLVLLGIGLYCQRRTQGSADYILGGKQLGPWVTALSACASSSSAWTLIGVSGYAYANGLSALWLLPGCVGGFALNWYLLAERLRRHTTGTDALTVTDVLAASATPRSVRTVRAVATFLVLASLLTYVAAQFHATGITFHAAFGLDGDIAIVIGAVVVVAYTWFGGFWAVSVTDTVQGMLMVAVAVVLPVAGVVAVGGFDGLSAGLRTLPEAYRSIFHGEAPTAALGIVLGLLSIGLGYPGQPHVVNRFMAVRDRKALVQARRISMVWAVAIYSGMVLTGLCARVLVPGLEDSEQAFLALTQQALPAAAMGLVVAAVLSAIMSTVDTQLLSAGTAITHDLRLGGPDDRSALRRSRIVVVLVSLGATVAALVGDESLFRRVLFAWTALGAAFGPLLMATVWRGPVGPLATVATMVVGAGLSVAAYYTPGTSMAMRFGMPIVVATVIAFAAARPTRQGTPP